MPEKQSATPSSGPSMKEEGVEARLEGFPAGMKDWFCDLDANQVADALGFVDWPVVSTIVKLAASSTSVSLLTKPTRPDDGTDRPFLEAITWESPVLLSRIEETYRSIDDSSDCVSQTTTNVPAVSSNRDAIQGVAPLMNTSLDSDQSDIYTFFNVSEAAVKDGGKGVKVESNAFRIRDDIKGDETRANEQENSLEYPASRKEIPSGEQPEKEQRVGLSENEKGSAVAETRYTPQLRCLMNHVCAVFPSAFKLAAPNGYVRGHPFITIKPSYLSTINGIELIRAFEEVMASYSSTSANFSSEPKSSSWMELILATFKTPLYETEPQIPLYMLLLLRFQMSLFQAYRKSISHINGESECRGTKRLHSGEANRESLATKDSKEGTDAISLESPTFSMLHEKLQTMASLDGSSIPVVLKSVSPLFPLRPEVKVSAADAILAPFVALLPPAGDEVSLGVFMRNMDEAIGELVKLSAPEAVSKILDESSSTAEEHAGVTSLGTQSDIKFEHVSRDDDAATVAAKPVRRVEALSPPPPPASPGKKNGKRKKKKKKRKPSSGVQVAEVEPVGAAKETEDTTGEVDTEKETTNAMQTESSTKVNLVPSPVSFETEALVEATRKTSNDAISPSDADLIGNSNVDDQKEDAADLPDARIDNVGTACEVSTQPIQQDEKATDLKPGKHPWTDNKQAEQNQHEDDDDAWETVEVKSRSNRKKASGNHGRFSPSVQPMGAQHGNGSKKKTPRNAASRKRNATRKMVRELLSSVLDSVDDEVRRRRQSLSWRDGPRSSATRWGPPVGKARLSGGGKGSTSKKETTMRDILVGRQSSNAAQVATGTHTSFQRTLSDRMRQSSKLRAEPPSRRSEDRKQNNEKGATSAKSATTPTADQNTAPTVPETLSAVSAYSMLTETPSARVNDLVGSGAPRSDSSSGEGNEPPKSQRNSVLGGKEASPSPPLPTLLSPGNANSASSSVASSLDAPHASHHGNHHTSSQGNENDVGYHLLRVCDRLTRDIRVFMKRRENALEVRRMERGLVLSALQDTLSTIWPGLCSVEMYGSCATDLDLPSSDLDVVVCGLDRQSETQVTCDEDTSCKLTDEEGTQGALKEKKQNGKVPDGSIEDSSSHQHSGMQMMYGQVAPNAERVMRLANELERQPWAVHVKAIPTATVPVIKILADPARLPGAILQENSEWLVQHPMTSSPTSPKPALSKDQVENNPATQNSLPHYHSSQTPPPWRGADVVNGLLKVDITFEGPEHGGIGSTTFSKLVVQNFCTETGLPPDDTPAVQVLMVLKELLAQRRLNEPFSGGLSSYALLLLVISVLRERAIVREELERVEKQRRMVAAGGGNFNPRSTPSELPGVPKPLETNAEKSVSSPSRATKSKGSPRHQDIAKTRVLTVAERVARGAKRADSVKVSAAKPKGAEKKVIPKPNQGADSKQAKGIGNKGAFSSKHGGDSSSWASIARKSAQPPARKASQDGKQNGSKGKAVKPPTKKVSSFADAVSKGGPGPAGKTSTPKKAAGNAPGAKSHSQPAGTKVKREAPALVSVASGEANPQPVATSGKSNKLSPTSSAYEPGLLFPQGFHDVIEVLCSGETNPGKLLMHFLLFYGQHFDSQSTAIDYSGTHERDVNANNGYSRLSPYMQRRTAGSYDPMTGMLTVDPIVVYDPLEGAETNNVARSCFAWSSIRWVFAQSYMTLSSAVEMRAGHTSGQGNPYSRNGKNQLVTGGGSMHNPSSKAQPAPQDVWEGPYSHDESVINMLADPSSSLLELLLAF